MKQATIKSDKNGKPSSLKTNQKQEKKMKLETLNKWLRENGYTKHPQIGGGYFKDVGFSYPVGFIIAENGDVDYCQLSNGYPVVIKCSCLDDLTINNQGKLAASWKKTGRKVLI